jgi:predicted extracellular nuclease
MALTAGDIAFVGFNSDTGSNGKSLAFVALAGIPAGEVVHFTDNGWLAANSFRTGEGFITWTAPVGGIAAGMVITITSDASPAVPSSSAGTVVEFGDVNFSTGGDQVIAFQGTVINSGTFTISNIIAALNDEGAGVWQSDATSANTSALPQGLTNGTTAVALNEFDNYVYSGPSGAADKTTWLTRINNSANWTSNDTTPQSFSGLSFTVTGGGDSTPPSVVSVTTSPSLLVDSTTSFSIAVLFNEAMDTAVAPTITFPTAGENPSAAITATGGSWSGNTYTATFTVTDANVDVANIDIRVADAKDVAGNTMAETTLADTFSVSQVNPVVDSSDPLDDATNVAVNASVKVYLSENATVVDGLQIQLRLSSDDSVVPTSLNAEGTLIELTPTDPLNAGVSYYVYIGPTALTDASGNAFAGLTTNSALNFTTASVPVPTVTVTLDAPTVQNEGNSGTTSYTYTVSWSDIATAETLNWSVAGSGANPADSADFGGSLPSGSFGITAGSGSTTITVNVAGDANVEPSEAFQLSVAPSAGITINQPGQATITNDDAVGTVSIDSVSVTEGDSGTQVMTFTVMRTGGAAPFDVSFATSDGTATTANNDYAANSGTLSFAAGQTSQTISVTINGDTAAEANETFSVTLSGLTNGGTLGTSVGTGTILNNDFTKIYDIQGSGSASALVGQTVTIRAVVTGDFQNGDGDTTRNLNGFTVQELVGDGNAATSDGIFIFQGTGATNTPNVNVGDIVTITGTVSEFNGETQISATAAGAVTVTTAGALTQAQVNALAVTLNLPSVGTVTNTQGIVIPDLEAYEGMLVNLPQTLTVSETFNLDRFGTFEVTQGGQAYQYTQQNAPSTSGYATYLSDIAKRTLTIDDGLWTQNPDIRVGGTALTSSSTFSHGDTISNVTGVIRYSNPIGTTGTTGATGEQNYRLIATEAFTVTDANPRDAAPASVGGTLKIASFNVLNFFTSLNTSTGVDPSLSGQDPRGADNNAEFDRQSVKLYQTLATLNADIVSLIELENDFRAGGNTNVNAATSAGGATAIQAIVNGLNAIVGAGTYDWVRPGSDLLGGDAISVGMIYRTSAVSIAPGTVVARLVDVDEVGGDEPDAQTTDLADLGLTSLLTNNSGIGVFEGSGTSRVPLAVTFQAANGETFTVVANHFKSKSSSSGGTGDADAGDGAGLSNNQRVEAATAVTAWLATNPTGDTSGRYVITGDLNAYAQEQPVQYILGQGYTNLANTFVGPNAYSYVFDGLIGTLDYGISSNSFTEFFTGATDWHINADEADSFDYNTNFKPPSQLGLFDASTPIRTSDHDPFLMGLDLTVNYARFGTGAMTGTREAGTKLFTTVESGASTGDGIDVLTEVALGNIGSQNVDVDQLTIRADGAVFDAKFVMLAPAASLTLAGTAGMDVDGNSLANIIVGNDGANEVNGFDGADDLRGNGGQDTLRGGVGNDTIDGGDDKDAVEGGIGDDSLYGSLGDDTISGNEDNDQMFGGQGADSQLGGDGADRVWDDLGNDTLFGGAGNDTMDGGEDNDRLSGDGDDDSLYGGLGNDTLLGGDGSDQMFGGQGNDYHEGQFGNDRIWDDLGNDTLNGGTGDDTMDGGEDNDQLYGNDDNDSLYGGLGDDSLFGGEGADQMFGGQGDDYQEGQFGDDRIWDDLGNDTLNGGTGNDTMDGGEDNDVLYGNADNDSLFGNIGNDTLWGNAGNDTLTGGDGADVFAFDAGFGTDLVADFQDGVDLFEMQIAGLTNFSQLTVAQNLADVVVLYSGNSFTIANQTVANITAADFMFS